MSGFGVGGVGRTSELGEWEGARRRVDKCSICATRGFKESSSVQGFRFIVGVIEFESNFPRVSFRRD